MWAGRHGIWRADTRPVRRELCLRMSTAPLPPAESARYSARGIIALAQQTNKIYCILTIDYD